MSANRINITATPTLVTVTDKPNVRQTYWIQNHIAVPIYFSKSVGMTASDATICVPAGMTMFFQGDLTEYYVRHFGVGGDDGLIQLSIFIGEK